MRFIASLESTQLDLRYKELVSLAIEWTAYWSAVGAPVIGFDEESCLVYIYVYQEVGPKNLFILVQQVKFQVQNSLTVESRIEREATRTPSHEGLEGDQTVVNSLH